MKSSTISLPLFCKVRIVRLIQVADPQLFKIVDKRWYSLLGERDAAAIETSFRNELKALFTSMEPDQALKRLVKARKYLSLDQFKEISSVIAEKGGITSDGLNEALQGLKGPTNWVKGNRYDRKDPHRAARKKEYAKILLCNQPQGFLMDQKTREALSKGDFKGNLKRGMTLLTKRDQ